MVQWSGMTLKLLLPTGLRTPMGKAFIKLFALIFKIPPGIHSLLAAGNSEIICTDHSQMWYSGLAWLPIKLRLPEFDTRFSKLFVQNLLLIFKSQLFTSHSRPSKENTLSDSVDTNGNPVPLSWHNFKTAFWLGL